MEGLKKIMGRVKGIRQEKIRITWGKAEAKVKIMEGQVKTTAKVNWQSLKIK